MIEIIPGACSPVKFRLGTRRLQDWLLAIVGLYRPVSVDLQSVLRGQAQETGSHG
jgi:hypothetical protein